MTKLEFVVRIVGAPWVKWGESFDGVDCYGCIVLYFREVLGIDLGPVPQTDIASGFESARGWNECGPEAGATCWMAWRDGAPAHCGLMLSPSEVLHAEGSEQRPGSVRVSSLPAVVRFYGPDVRFYRYSTPC